MRDLPKGGYSIRTMDRKRMQSRRFFAPSVEKPSSIAL
jgi:hypothetical protein